GGDPFVGLFVPIFGDDFAFFDEPFHVGAGGEVDDRRGLAGRDRATLVAGGAEGVAEADSLALGGLFEGGLKGFGVDRFRGRVTDHAELGASRGASARFFAAGARAAGATTASAPAADDKGDQQGEGARQAYRHAAPPGGASVPHLGCSFLFRLTSYAMEGRHRSILSSDKVGNADHPPAFPFRYIDLRYGRHMEAGVSRTPEERLVGLPDFPFAGHYEEVDGLRLAFLADGGG